jgi:nucleotide-binding universal stress UspA family protein
LPAEKAIELTPPSKQGCRHRCCNERRQKLVQPNCALTAHLRHCGRQGDLAMYQKILLAYDGSPEASEALAQAKSLASMSGATVRLLAIIDPSENMFVVGGMSFVPDNRRFVTQSVLDAGVRRLQGAGWTVTNDVRYGNPAEEIDRSAREMNADLIVVGHRDQGTLARWLNGSVGASILHHPPCSVLVAVKSEQQKNNVTPIRKTQAQARHGSQKTH